MMFLGSLPRSFKKDLRVFQESFNGVSRKFERISGNFREVLNMFLGCFKTVLRVFQERFKGASRKFQECFKKVSMVFQRRLKGVSMKF